MSIYQQPVDLQRATFYFDETANNPAKTEYILQDIQGLMMRLCKKCTDYMSSEKYRCYLNHNQKKALLEYYNTVVTLYTQIALIDEPSKKCFGRYNHENFIKIMFEGFHMIDWLDRILPTVYDEKQELLQEWDYFFENCNLDLKSLQNDENVKSFKINHVKSVPDIELPEELDGNTITYILKKTVLMLEDAYDALIWDVNKIFDE